MFDQLGDTSSTGTLQASSAQRIPRRAAALLEKMGCCSRGPWSAFPWSWRPPRSSTGKTKVVGLVELSMPAPLDYADYDGITSYHLALCDPPTGGPTYCRPLSGCRLPEGMTEARRESRAGSRACSPMRSCRVPGMHVDGRETTAPTTLTFPPPTATRPSAPPSAAPQHITNPSTRSW